MPTPPPRRPQIKSLSQGSYTTLGGVLVVTVETAMPDATVQIDGADVAADNSINSTYRGSIITAVPCGLDIGDHLITVTDAGGVSDAMQFFVAIP